MTDAEREPTQAVTPGAESTERPDEGQADPQMTNPRAAAERPFDPSADDDHAGR